MKNLTEREKIILNLLDSNPTLEVSNLTNQLYASAATIRRDLKKLEDKGLILRAYGKVISAKQFSSNNTAFDTRMQLAWQEKNRIAKAAVDICVQTGDVVMLDASSTVAHTVEYLEPKKATIITSGIQTLSYLAQTGLTFYSTGGRAVSGSYSLVGQNAIEYVSCFNADVCIVSCHGLTPDGFACDTSEPEIDIRKAMMKNSKKRVLVIDSSKFGKVCFQNLCHISEFDFVFCDKPLPTELSSQIKNLYVIE